METINISNLKAKLSAVLERVKAGTSVVVYDRKQPIAKVVPFAVGEEIPVYRAASQSLQPPEPRKYPKVKTDVVALLREDRDRR